MLFTAIILSLRRFCTATAIPESLACAAALESLKIFEDDDVLNKNREKSGLFRKLAESLAHSHPYVGEFRQIGMIAALELVENKAQKKEFDWKKRVGYNIYKLALKKVCCFGLWGMFYILCRRMLLGKKT